VVVVGGSLPRLLFPLPPRSCHNEVGLTEPRVLKCAPNGQWAEVGFASVCVDGLCLAKTDPVSKNKNTL